VKDLIEGLFNCFTDRSAFNTHYIMKALMRCFSLINNETAKNAHIYTARLEQMILQAIQNPINPQLMHFVFESLCVLIRKAYTKVEGGLDIHVVRIIDLIIPKDVVDFMPYALQVTALLLDQSQAEKERGAQIPQQHYLSFFPFLLKGDFWARSANIPALMLVLESFVKVFPEVVFGPEYVDQIIGCFQRLIGAKAYDQHGFRLAAAFLINLETYEKLTSRNVLLPMLNRLQQSKTTKYVRQLVLFFCRFAIVRGAQTLAKALDSIQGGLYLMLVEKVILPELKQMPHTTVYEEKRIITYGISMLIQDTGTELGVYYQDMVEAAIAVLGAFERRNPEAETIEETGILEDKYEESNENEYTDPYCKLSYAQHFDVVKPYLAGIDREALLEKLNGLSRKGYIA